MPAGLPAFAKHSFNSKAIDSEREYMLSNVADYLGNFVEVNFENFIHKHGGYVRTDPASGNASLSTKRQIEGSFDGASKLEGT